MADCAQRGRVPGPRAARVPARRHRGRPAGDAGPSRRTFMKVMGASMALAGLTGCRRPVETILPYARKPEDDRSPASPLLRDGHAAAAAWSTACSSRATRGGRRRSKATRSTRSARARPTSSRRPRVLNLYDPDRSSRSRRAQPGAARPTWGDFVAEASALARQRAGQPRRRARRAVVLADGASASASSSRQRFPGARWITYRAARRRLRRSARSRRSGRPLRPLYRFSKRRRHRRLRRRLPGRDGPNSVWNNREYAASPPRGRARRSMSRLYVVESTYTHRRAAWPTTARALRRGDVPLFAAAVAARPRRRQRRPADRSPPTHPFVAGHRRGRAGRRRPGRVRRRRHAAAGRPRPLRRAQRPLGGSAVEYLDTGADPVEPAGRRAPASSSPTWRRAASTRCCAWATNPVYTLPADVTSRPRSRACRSRSTSASTATRRRSWRRWHIPARPLPRSLGRRPGLRRHALHHPAAHRAALRRRPLGARSAQRARDRARSARATTSSARPSRRAAARATSRTAGARSLHDGFLPDTRLRRRLRGAAGAADLVAPPDARGGRTRARLPPRPDALRRHVLQQRLDAGDCPHPVTKLSGTTSR